MSVYSPAPTQLPKSQRCRVPFSRWLAAVLAAMTASSGAALAQTAVTLPAPPFTLPLPFLPSVANDWTVQVGVEGEMAPVFPGSKNYLFSPVPIFSVQRAGSPERFHSPRDSSSIVLFNYGQFRAGVAGRLDTGRTASSDSALRGLGDVGTTLELGGFAEYFPVEWIRTRVEIRNGFGAHSGVAGDLTADVIVPVTQRITFSAGPRFSFKDADAMSPYFNVDAAQSRASGLPEYSVKGGSYSAGAGSRAGYQLTPQWEVHSYAEYEHLTGSAAGSSLVKLRGTPDQLTVGIGASYSFGVSVR